MWYPKPNIRQSLFVVEQMHCTLAHALDSNENKIDKVAVLCDVAIVLAHLHDRGIVHGDVRAENVLVNDEFTKAKISDFGHSCHSSITEVTRPRAQQAGTLYLAPEVRANAYYKATPRVDCWGFGLMMCDTMHGSGRSEFLGAHDAELHRAANAWAACIRDTKVKIAAMACLQREEKRRPLMANVYLHLASAVPMGETSPLAVETATEFGPQKVIGTLLLTQGSSGIAGREGNRK